MNGAGAAAITISKLLLKAGFADITLCDRNGAIYEGRMAGMNPVKEEMALVTNIEKKQGALKDVLVGADVFIGVSAPGAVTTEMVQTMANDAIIFTCANPTPEIFPDDAKAGCARVISTGRSDFPNQINNVLAFPGIFNGRVFENDQPKTGYILRNKPGSTFVWKIRKANVMQKQRFLLNCIFFREAVMACAYVQKKSTGWMIIAVDGLSGA